jgi:large subunit ribosomal protein L6
MSRIGKLPIEIPQGTTVSVEKNIVRTKGSKGELEVFVNPKINVKIEDNKVFVSKNVEDRESASLYGLTRTLIANTIKGVSEGFKKHLEINGIGYRAAVNGDILTLNLGYSHPIEYRTPDGIHIDVQKSNITISGVDKQKVGQVASEIRSFRKPEPYKGKGVKYAEEVIRRKSGKTGAK